MTVQSLATSGIDLHVEVEAPVAAPIKGGPVTFSMHHLVHGKYNAPDDVERSKFAWMFMTRPPTVAAFINTGEKVIIAYNPRPTTQMGIELLPIEIAQYLGSDLGEAVAGSLNPKDLNGRRPTMNDFIRALVREGGEELGEGVKLHLDTVRILGGGYLSPGCLNEFMLLLYVEATVDPNSPTAHGCKDEFETVLRMEVGWGELRKAIENLQFFDIKMQAMLYRVLTERAEAQLRELDTVWGLVKRLVSKFFGLGRKQQSA